MRESVGRSGKQASKADPDGNVALHGGLGEGIMADSWGLRLRWRGWIEEMTEGEVWGMRLR